MRLLLFSPQSLISPMTAMARITDAHGVSNSIFVRRPAKDTPEFKVESEMALELPMASKYLDC